MGEKEKGTTLVLYGLSDCAENIICTDEYITLKYDSVGGVNRDRIVLVDYLKIIRDVHSNKVLTKYHDERCL